MSAVILPPHDAASAGAGGARQAVIPRATYRLQFHKDFGFEHAIQLLPYLARLGISHVYCSPLMQAHAGSLHGYDVVDYQAINPELGGREGFARFAAAARERGLGLLLDIVPNHMGIGPDNAWWMDVLENGLASRYARFFDIDWQPADPALAGKVLLPVLGDHFGRVLERGELRVTFEPGQGAFSLRYFDHRFPIDPRSAAAILTQAGERCDGVDGLALRSLAATFAQLPVRPSRPHAQRGDGGGAREAEQAEQAEQAPERARERGLLKQRLAALVDLGPATLAAIESALQEVNTPDGIDTLHDAQAYRLAFWRVAPDEINYRRFFDIDELAAMRMEDPAVFEAAHALVLELAASAQVDGLRIDHPDGLSDPAAYFERLQRGYARRAGLPAPTRDAQGRLERPLYVVAEKIFAAHEDVPDAWAIHGATGYRFANVVNGVLVDAGAAEEIDRIWRDFSGETADFPALAHAGKHAIAVGSLEAQLSALTTGLLDVVQADRRGRDVTRNALHEAIAETAACLSVYRTYVVDEPSAQDRRFIDDAIASARQHSQRADDVVFDLLRQSLLGQAPADADEALRARVRELAMRFQQFSAPVTAKGVEDTAFYRYHRLLSLNEVGGDPAVFGLGVDEFHAANADRAARWPASLIASSTHDNKRSEDVRCRLDVLSELPAQWGEVLARVDAWRGGPGMPATPSRADVYLLAQTLVGMLPAGGVPAQEADAFRERIETYALKCVREAKLHTSWVDQDAGYEAGVVDLVRRLLAQDPANTALAALQGLADVTAWFGAFNSASLVALKLTAPGVPDLYQGNETMDLSLVDPDNRRPVDYVARERVLDLLEATIPPASVGDAWQAPAKLRELAATPCDGRLKLWITWRLLQLRADRPALFREGAYVPLRAAGARAPHALAFARGAAGASEATITVVARLPARLLDGRPEVPAGAGVWSDARIEANAWPDGTMLRNVVTGEDVVVEAGSLALARVFETLPVAVLVRMA